MGKTADLLKRIKSSVSNVFKSKFSEYEKFFSGFDRLSMAQIIYIIDVIKEEIKISRGFGLVLRPEDEDIEKIVFLFLFGACGQWLNDQGEKFSDRECIRVQSEINETIRGCLKEQVYYYFSATPLSEVKSRYNCHLEAVVARLFRDFVSKKCAPFMSDKFRAKGDA